MLHTIYWLRYILKTLSQDVEELLTFTLRDGRIPFAINTTKAVISFQLITMFAFERNLLAMGEACAKHVSIWQIPNLRAVSWEVNIEQWFATWTSNLFGRQIQTAQQRLKRTGTEFSAEDLKEAIYKKVNWSGKITPRQLTFTSWNTWTPNTLVAC